MKTPNLSRRVIIYVLGILILALGVSFSIKSELGVSPNSSVAYALNLVTEIPTGTCAALIFSFFVLLQIVILRRAFKIINLLQIPASILFGVFVDMTGSWLRGIPQPEQYPLRLVFAGIGIVLVALGICLYLSAGFIPLAAEGLISAMSVKSAVPLARVKLVLDCLMVAASAAISLAFLSKLQSVREGTVLAALLIGPCLGLFMKGLKEPLKTFLHGGKEITPSEEVQ